MRNIPLKVAKRLENRKQQHAFRTLGSEGTLTDFSSNDYLGFSSSEEIFSGSHQIYLGKRNLNNGATGSRLLSGKDKLYDEAEAFLSRFHESEAALIFNSCFSGSSCDGNIYRIFLQTAILLFIIV